MVARTMKQNYKHTTVRAAESERRGARSAAEGCQRELAANFSELVTQLGAPRRGRPQLLYRARAFPAAAR